MSWGKLNRGGRLATVIIAYSFLAQPQGRIDPASDIILMIEVSKEGESNEEGVAFLMRLQEAEKRFDSSSLSTLDGLNSGESVAI